MITYPTKKKVEDELRLGANGKAYLNGGICLEQESSIDLNQSPYGGLLNMCLDDGGLPIKRPGQTNLYATSLGTGQINGVYPSFMGKTIIAYGTKLYTQVGTNQPVEIYSGLTNSKAFFFVYNSILYMMNGHEYIQYDGTTVKNVVPYIPKISINRKPDGSQSTVNESWNMLGYGFTDQFNSDGTSTTYKLSFGNLDATTVVSNIGGTEGAGFTVNRTTGEVNFSTAPIKGDNNVLITGFKTFADKPQLILKCNKEVEFASRIFITGNKDLPNYYFASGLSDNNDASYFPEKYKYAMRGSDKAVTGFVNHYDRLIVLKEDCTGSIASATGPDNTASFPVTFLNTEIGCDIPDSIQLINNNPVWANTYNGVCMLVSSIVPGEKNIYILSQNVNGDYERPGLLHEDTITLKAATSADFEGKYWLNVGDKAYVWDYLKGYDLNKPRTCKWFLYDNIKAACFFIRDNVLMFGHKERGQLCQFIPSANDFGQPINAIFKTKLIDFGYPDYMKNISDIWLTTRANSNSNLSITYFDDNGEVLATASIPQSQTKSFKWSNFKWSSFSWKVQKFAPTIRLKPKLKKIRYFQLELSNNEFNQNLSIISLVIKYQLTKRVR